MEFWDHKVQSWKQSRPRNNSMLLRSSVVLMVSAGRKDYVAVKTDERD
jgi:hypothetical protein